MKQSCISAALLVVVSVLGCQRIADVAVVDDSIYKVDPAPLLPDETRLGPRAISLGEGRSYWSGTAAAGKYAYQISQLGRGFDANLEFRDDTEWQIHEINLETLTVESLPAPPVPAPVVNARSSGFNWGGFIGDRGLILDVTSEDGRQFHFWDGDWVSMPAPAGLDGGVVAGHSPDRMVVIAGRPFSQGTLTGLYYGGTQGWSAVELPPNAALGPWDDAGIAIVYPEDATRLCVGLIDESTLQLNEQHCSELENAMPRSAVNGTTDSFITLADIGTRTAAFRVATDGWHHIADLAAGGRIVGVPWAPGSDALFLRYSIQDVPGIISVTPEELSVVAPAEALQLTCEEAGCDRSSDRNCPCAARGVSAPVGHQIADEAIVRGLIDVVNGRRNFHVQVTPFGEAAPLLTCAQDPSQTCTTERCAPTDMTCGGILGDLLLPPEGEVVPDISTVEVTIDILGEDGLDALTYEVMAPEGDEEFRVEQTATGLTITGTPGGIGQLTVNSTGIDPPAAPETTPLPLPAVGQTVPVELVLHRGIVLGSVVDATVAPDGGAMFLGPVATRLVRETTSGVEVTDIPFAKEVVFAPGSRFALANSGSTTVTGLDVESATMAGFYGCPSCRFGGEVWTRWVEFSPDGQCASVPLTEPVNEVADSVAVLCWESGQLEEKFVVNDRTKKSWFSRDHEWFVHAGLTSGITLYEVATGSSFPVTGSLGAVSGLMGNAPSTLVFRAGAGLYATLVSAGPAYASSFLHEPATAHAVRSDDQWMFFTRSNTMGSQELAAYEFGTESVTPISLMPARSSDTYVGSSQSRQIDGRFMWFATNSGEDVVIDMDNFAAMNGSPTDFQSFRVTEHGLLTDPACTDDCPFELFDTGQAAWRSIPRPSGIPAIGRELNSVGVLSAGDTELYIGELDANGNVANQRLVSRQSGGITVREVEEAFDRLGAPCLIYRQGNRSICVW